MTPVDSESALGRSGLLVHNYLLGPERRFQRLRLDPGL